MTARIEPYQDGLGNIHYRVMREFPNWPAAKRGEFALNEINPAAFVPTGKIGDPVDPPEEPQWPSDATASEYLAQAQHEAAIDGDECTATACLMVRGSGT
jgi:hypothetical protein